MIYHYTPRKAILLYIPNAYFHMPEAVEQDNNKPVLSWALLDANLRRICKLLDKMESLYVR
jgi:hypothetical protein